MLYVGDDNHLCHHLSHDENWIYFLYATKMCHRDMLVLITFNMAYRRPQRKMLLFGQTGK